MDESLGELEPFYRGRLYYHGRTIRYIVWNGVKDYKNVPPPGAIERYTDGKRLSICQVRENVSRELIEKLCSQADGIVFWTRSRKVYSAVKNWVAQHADIRIDV